jgi:uncharacterized protein YoaH (UPF0181 family)
MPLDFRKLDQTILAPSRRPTIGREGRRHFVHIYEDDSSLVDSVTTFLARGIESGDAVIVIAGRVHSEAFDDALTSSGIDIRRAREEGRYQSLGSDEALARFMVDGMPVPALFMESIGGLIESVSSDRKVRVFGEMVADLWADGRIPAAMRVEELWNDLASISSFELFCAYPADAFRDTELTSLTHMCRQHTQVIPPVIKERP